MIRKNGCDLSHWNSVYDFDALAREVRFVILKAGGSDNKTHGYMDPCFRQYYNELKKRNISLGAYFFVGKHCTSYAEGVKDAETLLRIIEDRAFEYPLYIDLEAPDKAYRTGSTEACKGFCNTLEAKGYYAGIYASDISGFKDRLIMDDLQRYDKWVARYGADPSYCKEFGIWQYSSKGMINGVSGYVDLDYSYKSYPSIMKRAHLNKY